jgi:hypothetical protein
VDYGDLACAEIAPLPEDFANDGCVAPRQQQFWPAHPRRRTRAENDDANGQDFSLGAHGEIFTSPVVSVKRNLRMTNDEALMTKE